MERETNLVYGLWRDETFAVVGQEWALRASEEIRAWETASTVAEALKLALGEDPAIWPPVDADAYDGFEDDEPFSLDDLGAVNDGDWPGMPAARTFDWLPEAEEIGETVETIFNGPYLRITPTQEKALLDLGERLGVRLERDDRLINAIARWPDSSASSAE